MNAWFRRETKILHNIQMILNLSDATSTTFLINFNIIDNSQTGENKLLDKILNLIEINN